MSGLGQSGSVGRDVARFDPVSLGAVCRSRSGWVGFVQDCSGLAVN